MLVRDDRSRSSPIALSPRFQKNSWKAVKDGAEPVIDYWVQLSAGLLDELGT